MVGRGLLNWIFIMFPIYLMKKQTKIVCLQKSTPYCVKKDS
ncbi:hypothetical protein ACUXCC_002287 [Cytobacillus horneckiae]